MEEVEIIKSIFLDDVTADGNTVEYKCSAGYLKIRISDEYPNKLPEIFVPGIPSIQNELEEYSKGLQGNPMLYDLIEKYKILIDSNATIDPQQQIEKVESIDLRAFFGETQFSKISFETWSCHFQNDLTETDSDFCSKETGKQFFLRLRRDSEYESKLEEIIMQ